MTFLRQGRLETESCRMRLILPTPGGLPSKWLGVLVIVATLVVARRSAGLVFHASDRAPQPETAALSPGPVGSADLYAWVVEQNGDQRRTTELVSAPAVARGGSGRSVANRNHNPLNMKLGAETREYVNLGVATISDIIPKDGGRFLKFDSPETGFRAAAALLSKPRYDDLVLDRALRRWSNNGYGAEIVASTALDARIRVPQSRAALSILLTAMAAAEGYRSFTIADEIRKALNP